MKGGRTRLVIGILLGTSFLAGGWIAWQARTPTSSPTAKRDYRYNLPSGDTVMPKTQRELLEQDEIDHAKSEAPKPPNKITKDESTIRIDLGFSNHTRLPKKERIIDLSQIQADGEFQANLPGNITFRLVAYMLILPQDEEAPILEPHTFAPLLDSDIEVAMRGRNTRSTPYMPPEFRPPILRLGFRTSGASFESIDCNAFDSRTGFKVLDQFTQRWFDDLYVVDLYLGIWHDTPIDICLDRPAGKPVHTAVAAEDRFRPIELSPGVWFQLFEVAPGFYTEIRTGDIESFTYKRTNSKGVSAFFQSGYGEATEQSFIQWAHSSSELYERLERGANVLATTNPVMFEKAALNVVHFPERTRVWLHLPSLPGMPNGRAESKDLLDVRLPIGNEVQINDISALQLAYQASEMQFDWGHSADPNFLREGWPEMGVLTPRQLLAEYDRRHPKSEVVIDSRRHRITIKDKVSWRERVNYLWNEFHDWLE